jgi:hypothetical protein
MRKTRLAAVSVVAALAWATPATASHLPGTFSVSRKGQLEVSSSVLVAHANVDMRGGWNHTGIACSQWRRLRVAVSIEYSPFGGNPHVFQRTRSRVVENCAEGGPNVGFTFSARGVGFGCADGRWRPGNYSFQTTTTHLATATRTTASLFFAKRGRC